MLKAMRRLRARWLLPVALAVGLASVVSACGGLAFTAANVPALVGDFERESGIAYGPLPRQQLDVYRPEGVAGKAPVVVFWYGGSWVRGDRQRYRFVGAALANAGYVAVLPDYRLYPQVRFPAFVEDAAAAFKWAWENAERFGGDRERMFVMGHSAGAHLAAMVALDRSQLTRVGGDPAWVRGLIGLSGPYVLTPDTPRLRDIFAPPTTPRDWRPIEFVDARSPPALLIHGAEDRVVWANHAERLAERLRAVNVPVTLEIVPGRDHADIVAAFSVPARSRAPVLAELREFIGAVSAPSTP